MEKFYFSIIAFWMSLHIESFLRGTEKSPASYVNVDLQFALCLCVNVCVCVEPLNISTHMQMWVSKISRHQTVVFFSLSLLPPFRRTLGKPKEMQRQAGWAQGL